VNRHHHRVEANSDADSAEEINRGSVIKINAELVQLHVRVIDRNNKPINNVPKASFTF
jgi:hypothetical protein